jgi:hypothetical protein
MPVDYTTYRDHSPVVRSGGSNAAGFPQVTIFENTFDATRRPLAAEDTVTVLTIPPGTLVQKVFVQVLSGEAAQTLNVGDSADKDGWVAAADVATTGTRVMGAGDFAAAGKFYTAATPLLIEVPATKAYATLRVRIVAACVCMG